MIPLIRKEKKEDRLLVEKIIQAAFEPMEMSDHREHLLVARLRKSDAFIPDLSLVAELDGRLVGHILLTRIQIKNQKKSFESLALAPVSVHPDFQDQGIGSHLINSAHQRAKALGYASIALIGHEAYYPRFGYQQASNFGIEFPFDLPKVNCMVVELVDKSLSGVRGVIEYDPAFFQ